MKRLTLFLVSATLLLASVAQAEPVTKIITRTKQVWVDAQYWNCTLTYASGKLSDCRFVYSRWAWVPEAARCGERNIGTADSPYLVTVCTLRGRRIIGPAPLPPNVTPS